jgi:hypothetical protein
MIPRGSSPLHCLKLETVNVVCTTEVASQIVLDGEQVLDERVGALIRWNKGL